MGNDPGIYALAIRLESKSTMRVGKFGDPPGWYVCVGSAFGAKGPNG